MPHLPVPTQLRVDIPKESLPKEFHATGTVGRNPDGYYWVSGVPFGYFPYVLQFEQLCAIEVLNGPGYGLRAAQREQVVTFNELKNEPRKYCEYCTWRLRQLQASLQYQKRMLSEGKRVALEETQSVWEFWNKELVRAQKVYTESLAKI